MKSDLYVEPKPQSYDKLVTFSAFSHKGHLVRKIHFYMRFNINLCWQWVYTTTLWWNLYKT